MNGYSVTLFFHLLFLIVAVVAASLTTFAMFQLRAAETARDAARWGMTVGKVVPAFPVASLGLFGSGAYMTGDLWTWSTPWIVASIVGLGLIVACGAGVEGSRGRVLEAELRSAGLSERARRLASDPALWTAKFTGMCLFVAVVFVMTTKPGTGSAVAALAGALVGGAVLALPVWRGSAEAVPVPARES